MNPEIKKLWVDTLRSGRFKQGREKLNPRGGEYCCLGVLCRLYTETTGKRWTKDEGSEELPQVIMEWAGLSKIDPDVRINGFPTSLVTCNDNKSFSFNQIAELIERYL